MDYMSPEQARGQPVTVRSDLYSLGTVMFSLLAGKPPFTSNSVEESLRNLTQVPAPLISSLIPDVPEELEQVIAQLMAKNPERRIQTAQSLIAKVKHVGQVLLDQSRAQTAENPPPKRPDETFVDHATGGQPKTRPEFTTQPVDPKRQTRARKKPGANTLHATKEEPGGEEVDVRRPDYFSTITEKVRKQLVKGSDDSTPRSKGGLIPILLTLILVLTVGAYGFYSAFRAPTAEELYQAIESNLATPYRARDEIQQFLELYPDDERAPQIRELQGIADAVAYYNTLSVRHAIPGESRLSPMEAKFLSIAKLAESDSSTAYSQLSAFVTLHSASKNLSEDDLKCVTAAENFKLKIKYDAKNQKDWARSQIQSAMNRAEEGSIDRAASAAIYRSIVELYEGVDWAQDLVTLSKSRLAVRNEKAESPKPDSD
jgi:serine/threonine-protein kinase